MSMSVRPNRVRVQALGLRGFGILGVPVSIFRRLRLLESIREGVGP